METMPSKGCKHTKESIEKMKMVQKGKVISEKTREKISKTLKSKYETFELVHHMKGKHHSEESKKKMSKSSKGKKHKKKRSIQFSILMSTILKGRIFSEETKKKMSESNIRYKLTNKGKFKDTKPELEIKLMLEKYNINYDQQFRLSNRLYDFYLPDYNLLIEVDGTYWHSKGKLTKDIYKENLKKIRENDLIKNSLALNNGYNLMRVWEDEIDQFENYCESIVYSDEDRNQEEGF